MRAVRLAALVVLIIWAQRVSASFDLMPISSEMAADIGRFQSPMPVLLDWPHSREGRVYPPAIAEMYAVDLANLEQMKQQIEKKCRGRAKLELIDTVPVIVPTKNTPDNLDIKINISVENASTWEAMKAITRAMSCGLLYGTDFKITLSLVDAEHVVPAWFFTDKVITLTLENVPVRTAIAKVMAQAPQPMQISYQEWKATPDSENPDWKGSSLYVQFWKDGLPMPYYEETPPELELIKWQRERDEAALPADNCEEVCAECRQRQIEESNSDGE